MDDIDDIIRKVDLKLKTRLPNHTNPVVAKISKNSHEKLASSIPHSPCISITPPLPANSDQPGSSARVCDPKAGPTVRFRNPGTLRFLTPRAGSPVISYSPQYSQPGSSNADTNAMPGPSNVPIANSHTKPKQICQRKLPEDMRLIKKGNSCIIISKRDLQKVTTTSVDNSKSPTALHVYRLPVTQFQQPRPQLRLDLPQVTPHLQPPQQIQPAPSQPERLELCRESIADVPISNVSSESEMEDWEVMPSSPLPAKVPRLKRKKNIFDRFACKTCSIPLRNVLLTKDDDTEEGNKEGDGIECEPIFHKSCSRTGGLHYDFVARNKGTSYQEFILREMLYRNKNNSFFEKEEIVAFANGTVLLKTKNLRSSNARWRIDETNCLYRIAKARLLRGCFRGHWVAVNFSLNYDFILAKTPNGSQLEAARNLLHSMCLRSQSMKRIMHSCSGNKSRISESASAEEPTFAFYTFPGILGMALMGPFQERMEGDEFPISFMKVTSMKDQVVEGSEVEFVLIDHPEHFFEYKNEMRGMGNVCTWFKPVQASARDVAPFAESNVNFLNSFFNDAVPCDEQRSLSPPLAMVVNVSSAVTQSDAKDNDRAGNESDASLEIIPIKCDPVKRREKKKKIVISSEEDNEMADEEMGNVIKSEIDTVMKKAEFLCMGPGGDDAFVKWKGVPFPKDEGEMSSYTKEDLKVTETFHLPIPKEFLRLLKQTDETRYKILADAIKCETYCKNVLRVETRKLKCLLYYHYLTEGRGKPKQFPTFWHSQSSRNYSKIIKNILTHPWLQLSQVKGKKRRLKDHLYSKETDEEGANDDDGGAASEEERQLLDESDFNDITKLNTYMSEIATNLHCNEPSQSPSGTVSGERLTIVDWCEEVIVETTELESHF